jgi:hypothetical protein
MAAIAPVIAPHDQRSLASNQWATLLDESEKLDFLNRSAHQDGAATGL